MSSKNLDDAIALAKLAEIAERYDDMAKHMKTYFKDSGEVNDEARNLVSVAFKNMIGSRRAAWRTLSGELNREEGKRELVTKYLEKVESELTQIHKDVIDLVDETLMPKATSEETKVFFQKMKGDYCRYKAEFSKGDTRKEAASDSLVAYKEATRIAESLRNTDATRLGLALNFSVFYYEIMGDPKQACDVAKKAFDDAISDLDSIGDDKGYKDTTLIMQLLRDNLTLWTSDADKQDTQEEEIKPEN